MSETTHAERPLSREAERTGSSAEATAPKTGMTGRLREVEHTLPDRSSGADAPRATNTPAGTDYYRPGGNAADLLALPTYKPGEHGKPGAPVRDALGTTGSGVLTFASKITDAVTRFLASNSADTSRPPAPKKIDASRTAETTRKPAEPKAPESAPGSGGKDKPPAAKRDGFVTSLIKETRAAQERNRSARTADTPGGATSADVSTQSAVTDTAESATVAETPAATSTVGESPAARAETPSATEKAGVDDKSNPADVIPDERHLPEVAKAPDRGVTKGWPPSSEVQRGVVTEFFAFRNQPRESGETPPAARREPAEAVG